MAASMETSIIKSFSILLLVCFTITIADEYHGNAVRSRHRRAAPSTVAPSTAAPNAPTEAANQEQPLPKYTIDKKNGVEEEEPCEEELLDLLHENRSNRKTCNLNGIWYNKLGSEMILNVSAEGIIKGEYRTAVEKGWGSAGEGHSAIVGQCNSGANPSFGFTVIWNEGESVTSWTGQCLICEGNEVLETKWVMSSRIDTCGHEWMSDRFGENTFTREEQSPGPRKALGTHTPRDFWRSTRGRR